MVMTSSSSHLILESDLDVFNGDGVRLDLPDVTFPPCQSKEIRHRPRKKKKKERKNVIEI